MKKKTLWICCLFYESTAISEICKDLQKNKREKNFANCVIFFFFFSWIIKFQIELFLRCFFLLFYFFLPFGIWVRKCDQCRKTQLLHRVDFLPGCECVVVVVHYWKIENVLGFIYTTTKKYIGSLVQYTWSTTTATISGSSEIEWIYVAWWCLVIEKVFVLQCTTQKPINFVSKYWFDILCFHFVLCLPLLLILRIWFEMIPKSVS